MKSEPSNKQAWCRINWGNNFHARVSVGVSKLGSLIVLLGDYNSARTGLATSPMGATTTETDIDEWGKEYKKWSEENSHMPNLQPADAMVKNFKNRMKQMANNPNAQAQPQLQAPSPKIAELEKRIAELENKLNSVDNQGDMVEEGLTEWEEDIEYKLDTLLNHLGVQI